MVEQVCRSVGCQQSRVFDLVSRHSWLVGVLVPGVVWLRAAEDPAVAVASIARLGRVRSCRRSDHSPYKAGQ